MHDTAYRNGQLFFSTYWRGNFRDILDIGAQNVNGSLRDFCPDGANYCGVDMAEGRGVDVVLSDPHVFPFPDHSFDIVVTSSALEHDEFFWLTFLEELRVLRPGGFLYINAPSNGAYHTYPLDCWRFYPDSGLALARWGQRMGHVVSLAESFIAPRMADCWNDTIMIFVKGAQAPAHARMADLVAGATNIRTGMDLQVRAHQAFPEDMTIADTLRAELASLRSENGAVTSLAPVIEPAATRGGWLSRLRSSLKSPR